LHGPRAYLGHCIIDAPLREGPFRAEKQPHVPFVHFLLGKLHITEAVSGKSICEYLGSMRKVHPLDKMGTIEFEREIAVWSELLLFACDQRIGSVEHDTRGTVSVSREALPADPVPLALGMSGDHLGLAMTKAPGVSPSPQGVTILWPTRPSPHFDDAAAFRFDSRAIGSRRSDNHEC